MAFWVIGMMVALAADKELRALRHGFGDQAFKAGERIRGYHGSDVHLRVFNGRAKAEGANAGFEERDELWVYRLEGDDAFDTNTILTSRLEDSSHKDGRNFREVTNVVQDDCRIFAAEFYADRGKRFRSGGADGVGNGARAYESDVADIRVGRQMVCGLGPANNGLDELRRVPAGCKGGASD